MAPKILFFSRAKRSEIEAAAVFVDGEVVYATNASGYGQNGPTDEAVVGLTRRPFPFSVVILDRHFPLPHRLRALIAELAPIPVIAYSNPKVSEAGRWDEGWDDTFADCGAEMVDGPDALITRLKTLLPTADAVLEPLALAGRDWLWDGSYECVATRDGKKGGGVVSGNVFEPLMGQGRSVHADILKLHGDDAAVRRAVLRMLLDDPLTPWDQSTEMGAWQLVGIPMAMTDEDIAAMLPEIESRMARGGLQRVRGEAPWGDKPERLADLGLTLGQALLARVAYATPDAVARWPQALQEEMDSLRGRWAIAEEAVRANWNRVWVPIGVHTGPKHDRPHAWRVGRSELHLSATPRNCMAQRGLVEQWNGEPLPQVLTEHVFARLSVSTPEVVVRALALAPSGMFVREWGRAVRRLVNAWGDRTEDASMALLPVLRNGIARRKRLAMAVLDGVVSSYRRRDNRSEGWGFIPRGWWDVFTALDPANVGDQEDRRAWFENVLSKVASPDPETARMLAHDPGIREMARDVHDRLLVKLHNNSFLQPMDLSNAPWLAEAREAERLRAAGSPMLASAAAVGHPRIGDRT